LAKPVRALAADSNSVYVGGDFTSISGDRGYMAQEGLAKFSASGSGALDSQWRQSFNPAIRAMAIDNSKLYITGMFGMNRIDIAGAGNADPSWQPDLVNGYVDTLAISGTNLFAGGWLTTASGLTNVTLVRASTAGSGKVDATWNPYPHRTDSQSACVTGLAANGDNIYIVGDLISSAAPHARAWRFCPLPTLLSLFKARTQPACCGEI